jgi:two-component system, NarL family, invasion response regulator UvrY
VPGPLNILICDDHEFVRKGVKQFLLEAFKEVRFGEAESSSEALDLFGRALWSLVVLDINIPGRNGLDLLTEMKAIRRDVPVLILSGLPEKEFAWRALQGGAAGYLGKTSIVTELAVAIRKILAGGRYISALMAEELASRMLQDAQGAPHHELSEREFQVFRSIARGQAVKEIAGELSLNAKTVSTYRARVCVKLGIRSDAELARYALEHCLIE